MQIDKDVPVPEHKKKRTGATEKFRGLEVGDSIVLTRAQVNGAFVIAKRLGITISRLKLGEDRFRVWRLA